MDSNDTSSKTAFSEEDSSVIQNFIPISSNEDWFDVLVTNDVEQAETILAGRGEIEQNILLNYPIDFELDQCSHKNKIDWGIYYPFHLAVVFYSKDITKMLIDRNVNLLATDTNQCNVLHACVITAFYLPHLESDISDMVRWLQEQLDLDTVKKLFRQENVEGYRPLEFACQQGCLRLMRTFFQSKAYVIKRIGYGIVEKQYHDITEYETGSRHYKSPMNMLPYVDITRLEQSENRDVILDPVFQSWINAKIKSNIIPILLWVFIRYSLLLLYMLVDLDVSWLYMHYGNNTSTYICPEISYINISSTYVKFSIITFVLVYFVLSILLDQFETIKKHLIKGNTHHRDINGSKSFVVSTLYYHINHFLLCVVIVFNYSVYLVYINQGGLNPSLELPLNIVRAFIPILIMWSFSYFLQLLPHTGSAIISIQGMQIDLLKFIFMFIIIILPFLHAFQSFVLYNSVNGCVDDFSSVLKSLYTMLLLMINTYDLDGIQVQHKAVLQILHIAFIFIVGIMLLNFLIAIMASKASNIAANERMILKLNQLAIVVKLEQRIYFITRKLYKYLRQHAFYCEDNKVYIISDGLRITKLLAKKKP